MNTESSPSTTAETLKNHADELRTIPACLICRSGFDSESGCVHTRRADFEPAPLPVQLGPGGVYLIDQTAIVTIAINPQTGLPIVARW